MFHEVFTFSGGPPLFCCGPLNRPLMSGYKIATLTDDFCRNSFSRPVSAALMSWGLHVDE
jgi:hypothetical protein